MPITFLYKYDIYMHKYMHRKFRNKKYFMYPVEKGSKTSTYNYLVTSESS